MDEANKQSSSHPGIVKDRGPFAELSTRMTATGLCTDAPGTFALALAAKAHQKAPPVSVHADLWPAGMRVPVAPVRLRPARKGARMQAPT